MQLETGLMRQSGEDGIVVLGDAIPDRLPEIRQEAVTGRPALDDLAGNHGQVSNGVVDAHREPLTDLGPDLKFVHSLFHGSSLDVKDLP